MSGNVFLLIVLTTFLYFFAKNKNILSTFFFYLVWKIFEIFFFIRELKTLKLGFCASFKDFVLIPVIF